MMFSYICRKGFDIASFDFTEDSQQTNDFLRGLGEGDLLRFRRGQGDDVLFSSFPRDPTSAEYDNEAAGRPALVSVSCPV